jgi:signal transduction histidine kinase
MNATAEQLTGLSFAAAEGKPVEEIFSLIREEDHKAIGNPVRIALSNGAAIQDLDSVCLLAGNNELVPIEHISSPIRSDRGDTIGAVVVFRSLERSRRAEDLQERLHRQQARVGHDLHEGLAQLLTGIAFLTKSLEMTLADRSESEAGDAANIVKLVNSAIKQTRELSASLLPVESAN